MISKKNFFIAQKCLNYNFIHPIILPQIMNELKNGKNIVDILLRHGLTQEQCNQLQHDWEDYCRNNHLSCICSNCQHENFLDDEEKLYLCHYCHKPLNDSIEKKSMDSNTNLLHPEFIGPYKIEKEMGRGGMGIVYKVRHPDLDFPLALKILMQRNDNNTDTDSDDDLRNRFFREIDLASKLRHPNIVGIHDVGSYNGTPYYTMDYIEGQTLEHLINNNKNLSQEYILRILEKIASGLASAHRAGIIHRDIKPSNIMIDKNNHPYLMDFGIAKCRDKMFKKLTKTGAIMGTPDYMPPEQAKGDNEQVSFASDVYSLGATMYFALSGKTPYDGKTSILILQQVLQGKYVAPRQINPNISIQTEAVIQKAMSYFPKDRYQNASAMAFDLQALLEGKDTIAKPNIGLRRILKKIKHNLGIAICLSISILAILITIIYKIFFNN